MRAALRSFKQKVAAHKASMDAAYALAVKDYTKASKDDEAAAVEKEATAFKTGLPIDLRRPVERFAKGTIWRGVRLRTWTNGSKNLQKLEVVVMEHDEKGYRLSFRFDDARVPSEFCTGTINEKGEMKLNYPHNPTGLLKGESILITYTGPAGAAQVTGRMDLRLVKK